MRGFLPDQTRISQVHLRTAGLERALEFYSGLLGLKASIGPGAQAILSAMPKTPGLLVLSEDRNASPRLPGSTGLYHFALRYPTRNDLAQAYRRIVQAGYPVAGASDHGVSEAIYLGDPDGNGVELYTDRPRSSWRWQNGQIAMVTTPLDLDNFLATIPAKTAITEPRPQIDLGHIHLHVKDLDPAERFYSEFLGLGVTQRSYPGALFFAADGYHHHIGVNVWAGQRLPPANSVGLVSYRMEVPVAGNPLLLEPSRTTARLRSADGTAGTRQPHSPTPRPEWKLAGSPGIRERSYRRARVSVGRLPRRGQAPYPFTKEAKQQP